MALRTVRRTQQAYARRMPAYVIVETDIHDAEQFERYRAAVPEKLAANGGRVIARGGALSVLEGDWRPKRLVLLEFDNLDAVKRWYESSEYQDVKRLRELTGHSLSDCKNAVEAPRPAVLLRGLNWEEAVGACRRFGVEVRLQIVQAQLGPNAGVVGAALVAFEALDSAA